MHKPARLTNENRDSGAVVKASFKEIFSKHLLSPSGRGQR
jgi:hypothetical protein